MLDVLTRILKPNIVAKYPIRKFPYQGPEQHEAPLLVSSQRSEHLDEITTDARTTVGPQFFPLACFSLTRRLPSLNHLRQE
jgi:hypothetical protein